MFRSIGTILIIWYLSHLFTQTFSALDRAGSASLGAFEAAAVASQKQFVQ